MSLLDKLERKYGRYEIPNVTLAFIFVQVPVYIFSMARPELIGLLSLVPQLVLQGQWWRLLSFLAVPPVTNPIFAFFFWYMFYLMGTALESHWGAFRYNIFILIGYFATLLASFLVPDVPSSNGFLQASVFLAFAYLFPDFQIFIMFILPVKIKYLAIITWVLYFYKFAVGPMNIRLLVLSSVLNFLIFFGRDIWYQMRTGKRSMVFQAKQFAGRDESKPFHTCTVCGITDLSQPDMDFRYCPDCAGSACYCTDHIRNHDHLLEAQAK